MPLPLERARRVTDESTDEYWAKKFVKDEEIFPPDKRGANRPTMKARTIPVPQSIRLTARLRAPKKALVLWSTGPEGVDDGGRICYDVSNGVGSVGDIVMFPEGY